MQGLNSNIITKWPKWGKGQKKKKPKTHIHTHTKRKHATRTIKIE